MVRTAHADFDGSRVDVIFADDAAATLDVKIDGQNPLDDPQRMHHGRNRVKWRGTAIPPGPWPPVLQMGFAMPLVVEDWKLVAKQDTGRLHQRGQGDTSVRAFKISLSGQSRLGHHDVLVAV